nr:hypothetical protein [Candidatus Sigynarchaeota archaeon]
TETSIRRLGEALARHFSRGMLGSIFEDAERIYLDLSIPLEQQLLIVNQIYKYFKKSPVFYIKRDTGLINDRSVTRAPTGVQFLDENMMLKQGSIDLLLMMRAFSATGDIEAQTFSLLKPTGILVAATLRENLRDMTPLFLKGVNNLFKDLFDEPISSKLMTVFSEFLYSRMFYSNPVSNKNIEGLLLKYFKAVYPVDLPKESFRPLFDAFVAREPLSSPVA